MSLKIVNLSKRIKDKWVLRDISFELARGEIFGLMGPSGAGKTVLLDIILGRSQASTGAIFFDDHNVSKLGRDARTFHTPEPADGSIWQRLLKNGGSASKGERQARVLYDAIDQADKLLLLDDPLCGLDAGARKASLEKIRDTARKGVAVIFASSDFEEIMEVCDRAAVIAKGELRQIGPAREIYERPESRAVAEITGRNNLFAARRLTSSKADVPEFHTIDGGHRLFAQRIQRGALGALNQNVTLGIRPEQVSISFGASFPADNLLKATITQVRFLGATTIIELDAGGLKLEALVLRLVGLNIGDECMVGLPPERILILRD